MDGELMLLHQGAAAFTLWTGQPAPIALMQEKLAAARAGGLRSAEGEPVANGDGSADAAASDGQGPSGAETGRAEAGGAEAGGGSTAPA
jgi:hypothetical protein